MPAIAGRRIARQLDVDADRGDDGIECSRARDFAFPVSLRAWLPTRRPESNSPIPAHIGCRLKGSLQRFDVRAVGQPPGRSRSIEPSWLVPTWGPLGWSS